MLNSTKYYCGICDTKPDQISHHKSHLNTEKHNVKKELFLLKLKSLNNEELIEKYNSNDIENIIDNIETIIIKNKNLNYSKEDLIDNNLVMTDFDKKTVKELKDYCRDNNITGYSNKKKAELIIMIEKFNKENNVAENNILNKNEIKNFKKYKRTDKVVYKRSEKEIEETRQDEEFKSLFIYQLNKWHNLLRESQVTGDDAMEDILYCLFLCYLSSKVSTEGDFDLANSEKSCYKGIIQRKINDWISKLNIDYLIDNTAELVTKKIEDSSIYKCGELLSRHPITKQLIVNKKFINCNNNIILSQLLKECKDFSTNNNIFEKIDIVGYTWEYFNTSHSGNKGTSREFGQYFTERPVMYNCCQLIDDVHLKELKINENSTIGDEFCATFGFPLYTKKFLKDKHNISIQDKNMYGVEFNKKLAKFGIMNAMFSLKNFKKVKCGDSYLTNVSPHLDISIHNVPMGHGNGTIIEKTYNSYKTENPILNLPDYKDIVKYNTEKGTLSTPALQLVVYKTNQMGLVITKDGVETSGDGCFEEVRKWMCDSCVIHKIMKIPTGAFSHTGTKTVCIYFTKREGQKTENIQFLEMSDTGDKITEICEVTRNDLEQNKYSWDPNVYIVDEEMEKLIASSGCEWNKLGDVCEMKPTTKHYSSIGLSKGKYKFYVSALDCNLYLDTCEIKKLSLIIGNGGQANIHIDNNFTASKHVTVCQFNNETYTRYVYWFLKTNINLLEILFKGGCMKWLNKNNMKSIDIPIPPQETQTQTVQTLDDLANLRQNYMDIRDGLERRMKYYFETMIKRHRGEITMEKLGDVCEINKYNITKTDNFENIKYIDLTSIDKGKINEIKTIEFDKKPSRANRKVNAGNVLLGTVRPNLKNHTMITDKIWENNLIVSTAFSVLESKNINPKYLYFCIMSDKINQQLINLATGSPPTINTDNVKKTIIPVLPNKIIDEIVQYLDNLEAEKNKITETIHQLDTEMREILTQSYE